MFHAETRVADALAQHPKARWVFAAYHLGGCNRCERSASETLQEVAEGYKIPLENLLRDLNALNTLNNNDNPNNATSRPEAPHHPSASSA